MWSKVIAGSPVRKTRLHDELGNLVPLSRLLRNGPAALLTGGLRLALGVRPERPWISYDAQKILDEFLTPQSRVLEYGSGMSTMWYARRCGKLFSVDHYRPWFDRISRTIAERGIGNIDYRFVDQPEAYAHAFADEEAQGFDLVMIDGGFRDHCVRAAIACTRPGGIIYLDNTDKQVDQFTGNLPVARQVLLDWAKETGASTTFFTDFAPTQLFVQQGLLVRRR